MTLPRALLIRFSTIVEALPPAARALPSWLSTDERAELARLRDAARRQQWLAGRWLSKRFIGEAADVSDVGQIQILSRDERQRGVRPRIMLDGRRLDWSLSISHTDRGVLVALVPTDLFSVGIDLARDVTTAAGFRRLWFSAGERQWIDDDPRRATVAWAVKEAVYKAANTGETWDPRDVEVVRQGSGDFPCTYRGGALSGLTIDVRDVAQCGVEGHFAAIACLPRFGQEHLNSSQPLGTAEPQASPERVNACS